jgi:hypothetical protein
MLQALVAQPVVGGAVVDDERGDVVCRPLGGVEQADMRSQAFVIARRIDNLRAYGAETRLGVGAQVEGEVGERALALGIEFGADPVGEPRRRLGRGRCLVAGQPVRPGAPGVRHAGVEVELLDRVEQRWHRHWRAAEDGPAAQTRTGAPGLMGDHGHGGLPGLCWK